MLPWRILTNPHVMGAKLTQQPFPGHAAHFPEEKDPSVLSTAPPPLFLPSTTLAFLLCGPRPSVFLGKSPAGVLAADSRHRGPGLTDLCHQGLEPS